jgi:Lhr-like helicase
MSITLIITLIIILIASSSVSSSSHHHHSHHHHHHSHHHHHVSCPQNVLVGAPTGSGKTITGELAILRLLNEHPGAKTIYIAPLKALARERLLDWQRKLGGRGSTSAAAGKGGGQSRPGE